MPPAFVAAAGIGFFERVFLEAERRGRATLETSKVALAAERFRRDRKTWPATLGDLVPTYLATVPADPFDGQPMRMRRLPDGIVIYSVGPDLNDDGGEVRADPNAGGQPKDVGVRLWDVSHRRQPPAPPSRQAAKPPSRQAAKPLAAQVRAQKNPASTSSASPKIGRAHV